MSKMKLGYSPLTGKVYLGKQNEEKQEWVGEKRDVTNEFINVCLQFLEQPKTLTCKSTQDQILLMQLELNVGNIQIAINLLEKELKALEPQKNICTDTGKECVHGCSGLCKERC